MAYRQNSTEYVEAFRHATMARTVTKGTFQDIIDEFFNSSDFKDLAERTKKDHRGNVARKGGIEEEFGKAPIQAFEDKRIKEEILRWRDKFTSGTGDNMIATLQRIISFANDRGLLAEHYLLKINKKSKSNRAEIVWTRKEVDLMVDQAPRYVGFILIAAVETGLRPGNLRLLSRSDCRKLNRNDSRIAMMTQKSNGKNIASIPVSWRMAQILEELPADQERIVVAGDGQVFKNADSLGRAISEWRDRLGIRKELRLYDARGTAATRLLRAGCNMAEIAAHMGWGIQYAAQMVERYAALDPDMTDGVLDKVERLERLDAEYDD